MLCCPCPPTGSEHPTYLSRSKAGLKLALGGFPESRSNVDKFLFLGVDQPSHRQIGQVCELCSGARV